MAVGLNHSMLKPGVSNLSAMAGRIDFILGVAGHYAISAADKACLNVNFNNVVICRVVSRDLDTATKQ